jgi:glycosyltransferase involved in cell wall biosynthesis
MISTDRKILDTGSVVAGRMREYADVFGELHIVVFSTQNAERRTYTVKLSDTCFAYATNSRSKMFYIFDALRIGSQVLHAPRSTLHDWIITTQDPFETGIVGLFLARKFSLKLNVQIHTDFLSPCFTRGSRLNKLRLLLARYVLPRAISIRVVSERIRRSLSNVLRSTLSVPPITVLPIYSEYVTVAPSTSDRFPQFDKVVLMASRLEPEKDIATALRAFALVSKSVKKVGLVIAGAGSMEAELAHISLELGIAENVLFLGWRDATELAHIRASSDIFLSTSLYEGYGISLLEAAQAKMPIVSTDAGIASDLLPRERLAEPGDVGAITRLILEALEHGDRFVATEASISSVTYRSKDEYLKRLNQSLLV